MLAQLLIRNFAIIDQSELDLSGGMTALTGETGAGKSILLDALGLVLGDRADTDSIRDGTDKAEITAVFQTHDNTRVRDWLTEHDLDADGECIMRRVISRDNRSRAYINGSPVALQMLRTLGEMLVNIHGQHEHQSLTRSDYQRRLLDAHAGNQALLDELRSASLEWERALKRLEEIAGQREQREQRLELLQFQLQEFDALNPDPEEIATIEAEHKRAANSGTIYDLASQAANALYEDDNAIHSQLTAIEQRLIQLAALDERAAEFAGMISSAAIQCSEAADGLRGYLGLIDADPARLQWLDERLSAYHALARKHQIPLVELVERAEALRAEVGELENSDITLENLEKECAEKAAVYAAVAARLSETRKQAAESMSTQISAAMQDLAMKGGVFAIEVEPRPAERPNPLGCDDIRFLVSANPGQKPRPLGKVASGGELSRISLAVQLIAAGHQSVPTMIFDEVDTGVGGAVAETVGRFLRMLGENAQILCVTHLPQVASQAHHHLRVSKETDGKRTETRLTPLDDTETLEEISRMLGGHDITEQTREHAREMLARAGQAPAAPKPTRKKNRAKKNAG
ncbi:DNA repair protein RecN [Granulosicoccaceae sp. 1_MG-2023]|nr:DNA repair protein RecN [Granulosicoccaceae sp. 1_MG-2023]